MSDELKACPFCGEQPRLRALPKEGGGWELSHPKFVNDPHCVASILNWYPTWAMAAGEWNRREGVGGVTLKVGGQVDRLLMVDIYGPDGVIVRLEALEAEHKGSPQVDGEAESR